MTVDGDLARGVSDPVPGDGHDRLGGALALLTPEERETLADQLERLRAHGRPLDAVALFHDSAKVDLADPEQISVFAELQSVKAPSMEKVCGPVLATVPMPRSFRPLEQALGDVLDDRVSGRDYTYTPLDLDELATLLHYSCGVRRRSYAYNTRDFPFRYAPSAGGLLSVETYVVANHVAGLERGLWHFSPQRHELELLSRGQLRHKVTAACAFQEFVQHASAVVVLTCVMDRVEWKYGVRSYRYVHLDTGVITAHLYQVGTALGLAVCAVAGFSDDEVDELLALDGRREFTSLLVAVGRPPRLLP